MIEVESEDELNRILGENEGVLVLFYASWCPYCTRFVPVFDRETAGFKLGKVIHVLLDDYDNPLWDIYDVEAVPTAVFFQKGKVCSRLDGRFGVGLNARQLSVWFEELNGT